VPAMRPSQHGAAVLAHRRPNCCER
jgi:hypothetical protein